MIDVSYLTDHKTRAVDMYSAGLVAHFVMYGVHPCDPAAMIPGDSDMLFYVRREVLISLTM